MYSLDQVRVYSFQATTTTQIVHNAVGRPTAYNAGSNCVQTRSIKSHPVVCFN